MLYLHSTIGLELAKDAIFYTRNLLRSLYLEFLTIINTRSKEHRYNFYLSPTKAIERNPKGAYKVLIKIPKRVIP